jgi:hypothetical protein
VRSSCFSVDAWWVRLCIAFCESDLYRFCADKWPLILHIVDICIRRRGTDLPILIHFILTSGCFIRLLVQLFLFEEANTFFLGTCCGSPLFSKVWICVLAARVSAELQVDAPRQDDAHRPRHRTRERDTGVTVDGGGVAVRVTGSWRFGRWHYAWCDFLLYRIPFWESDATQSAFGWAFSYFCF